MTLGRKMRLVCPNALIDVRDHHSTGSMEEDKNNCNFLFDADDDDDEKKEEEENDKEKLWHVTMIFLTTRMITLWPGWGE